MRDMRNVLGGADTLTGRAEELAIGVEGELDK